MAQLTLSLNESLRGSYDEKADVLYISIGAPRPAVGVEIDNGVIVRYDEDTNEIVGITIIGIRESASYELSQPIPEEFLQLARIRAEESVQE